MDSAVYFYDYGFASPLNMNQIVDLHRSQINGKTYAKIKARDTWIQHLDQSAHKSGLCKEEIDNLFEWAATTRINPDRLANIITSNCWRTCLDEDVP